MTAKRIRITAKCAECGKEIIWVGGPIVGEWRHNHEPIPKPGTTKTMEFD